MAVDALPGISARQYYSIDSGSNYTELTDLIEIGSPEDGTAAQIPATPLNPTNNSDEFINGIINNGMAKWSQYWNKSRYATMRAYVGTKLTWKTVFPDNANPALGTKIVYAGNLVKCAPGAMNKKDAIPLNYEVQITGAVTVTQGS